MTARRFLHTPGGGLAGALLAAAICAALLAGGGAARAAPGSGHGAASAAGIISTIAGGVGGPGLATKVSVNFPCGVSFAAGNLYISQEIVRAVSEATGRLTTPAGAIDIPGASPGDGGPAAQANVGACSTATDRAGNLVIADSGHNRVRVVAAATGRFYGQQMTAGDIYTVAGNGTAGFSGDGGPAVNAELNMLGPVAADGPLAVDGHGNLVLADPGNNRVRVVAASNGSFYGQPMNAGDIYTVAGDGAQGPSGDGGPATSAAVDAPSGVAVDGTGNLLLMDAPNFITQGGTLRVVAASTGAFYGQQMTVGDIYTIAGGGHDGLHNGIPGPQEYFYGPGLGGLAIDSHGNPLLSDSGFAAVAVYAASSGTFYGQQMTAGDVYIIAGLGAPGPWGRAGLTDPWGLAADSAGNVLIGDVGANLVRVLAASSGTFYGQAMTAGHAYTVAGNGYQGFSGDRGPATAAELSPGGVALDPAGNLVTTDQAGARLRVVPAQSGTFYGQQMTAGHIYTIAGGGTSYPGDGGPATSGEFGGLAGLVLDGAGNLVVADEGGNRVRMVAVKSGSYYGQQMTAGDIYTVAGNGARYFMGDGGPAVDAQIGAPESVALDGTGNLLLTDFENNRVRVVAASTGTFYGQPMTAGDIYTVAGDGRIRFNGDGKPATQAGIDRPYGVAVDAAGNLVLTDSGNNRVRVVAASTGTFYGQQMTAGDIYTVAGNGTAGFTGDGGPARQAELNVPESVALDGTGNLLVTDASNQRIRVIAASTGTFYGQRMAAGHIYTVAGGGTGGLGDGGPATGALLSCPEDAIPAAGGGLLIADTCDGRVRLVSG